jgi:hypothetical protein
MNAYASSSQDFSHQVEDFMDAVCNEVRHAARYVDTVIVPEVRRESGGALRTLAIHMERWADKLDPMGARRS